MADAEEKVVTSSIGCATLLHLLTIAFVVMKLADIGAVGDWSWFYVLLPSIVAIAPLIILATIAILAVPIILAAGIVALIIVIVIGLVDDARHERKMREWQKNRKR